MSSVKTIVKITKSSKMIAAAKFKASQSGLAPARAMVAPFFKFWEKAANLESLNLKNEEEATKIEGVTLYVPVTADKGLCGAANSTIIRPMRRIVVEKKDMKIISVGERAKAGLVRNQGHLMVAAYTGAFKLVPPTFPAAMSIGDSVASVDCDQTIYVWNFFRNAISYETNFTRIPSLKTMLKDPAGLAEYEIEGNEDEVLQNLYEFSQAIFSFYFTVETGAVEQSQRMNAMENSTKNANELIDKLRIQYNRSRQARITTELTEIISGAAAVEES